MEELSDGKQVHVHIHQAAPTQTQAPSRPHRPPTRVHARPWWVSGSGFGWISLYTLLLAGLGLGIYILIKEGLL